MLVRKLPVKLALETRQMGWTEEDGCKKIVSLYLCLSVCLMSIHQPIHNVHVSVWLRVDGLLILTLYIHSNDLRRKPSCTSHKWSPARVSRMSFLRQSRDPRKRAVINMGAQMPGLDPLLGSFCVRHIRGVGQGGDYGKEAQGSKSGQLALVFVYQHCQI